MKITKSITLVSVLFLPAALYAGSICPPVGFANAGASGTGCYVLFTFTATQTGGISIARTIDTTVGRYDAATDGDDITVGVRNLTDIPVTRLDLTKTNPFGDFSGFNIFNFDGDGICSVLPPVAGSPPCPYLPPPNTGFDYAGPLVSSYSLISFNEGTVFFAKGIPSGASTYFGLEDVPDGHTPEPQSVALLTTGGAALIFCRLWRRRSS
ncbi:MAG: hypothetical protein JO091_02320 [Acidobacteriaceae bacterium]|nr:hypothetical protein [Acidobacteriaceae bacterium]